MALTKPILDNVVAWDVADGCTFTFNVIGGDAVVGNTLYILDNSTNEIVYTLATTSYQYKAIVPANAVGLSNGTYYNAYIVTENSNGDISVNSNIIQFYCYTTPTWEITNIEEGDIVSNSSIAPSASYIQIENETLNDYTFILYNASRVQIATSNTQYVASPLYNFSVSYSFNGLENDTAYYIRAIGHTIEGTFIDTGFINFTASYLEPSNYSILNLTNNCDEGYILYESLAIDIEGNSNPSPPVYTTDGVDLTAEGSYVNWNNNFAISGNYTMKAWVQNPIVGTTLINAQDENGNKVLINYIFDPEDSTKVMIWLVADMGYICYSNSIAIPSSSDVICIQVRYMYGTYSVQLVVI